MLTEKMRSDVCSNTKHPVFAKESFNLLFDGDVPLESIQLIAELNKVNDNGSGASRVGRSTVQLGGAKLMGSKKQLLTKSEYHDLNAHRRVRVQVQFHAPIPASVQGESNEFVAGQLIGTPLASVTRPTHPVTHCLHPHSRRGHAAAAAVQLFSVAPWLQESARKRPELRQWPRGRGHWHGPRHRDWRTGAGYVGVELGVE